MALRIIDGVPGAGKTYYAVWHLIYNYFKKVFLEEKPEYGFWVNLLYALLPFLAPVRKYEYQLDKDCLIITNIDGFKPEHVDLRKEIQKAGLSARAHIEADPDLTPKRRESLLEKLDPVAEFFSFRYQEWYKEDKPQIVYVIDEAQRYFRKGSERVLRDRGVFDYFEYHRHWGQDIYLVTQNVRKLPFDLTSLPEYIVTAVPRIRTVGRGFKYHWLSSGDTIKKEVRRKDQGVFALYKSMDKSEAETIKNPMLKTIGMAFLGSFLVCYIGYRYFTSRGSQPAGNETTASVSLDPAVADPSSVSAAPSYIPIIGGGSRPVEPVPPPQSRYVAFVPLKSRIAEILLRDGRYSRKIFYVWRGNIIPAESFPYKTVYLGKEHYAVLDYDLFDFIFSDGSGSDDGEGNYTDDRPRDVIIQVAGS